MFTLRLGACFPLAVLLAACISMPTPDQRRAVLESRAALLNYQSLLVETDTLDYYALIRTTNNPGNVLHVYIEGDGLAWHGSSTASLDATPVNPVAFDLSMSNNSAKFVVYLGRACQYLKSHNRRKYAASCKQSWWTDSRYSEQLVLSMAEAISAIARKLKPSGLVLHGYSGGGSMAALIAARMAGEQEVRLEKLVTYAANLDTDYWAALHNYSPMSKSLNPMEFREDLIGVAQTHFVGSEDKNVPPDIIYKFVDYFDERTSCEVIELENVGHVISVNGLDISAS